jgi:hypothetical protein
MPSAGGIGGGSSYFGGGGGTQRGAEALPAEVNTGSGGRLVARAALENPPAVRKKLK